MYVLQHVLNMLKNARFNVTAACTEHVKECKSYYYYNMY